MFAAGRQVPTPVAPGLTNRQPMKPGFVPYQIENLVVTLFTNNVIR